MRYRSGGPFADAVAAVRAGRRPPRPNQSTSAGRASPTSIPSGTQARVVATPTGRAPAARRSRSTTGGHRTPPPRRTFSSGQRALLWAAGVLGALAIVIAVLIVINSHDNNAQPQSPAPTVTDTGTPPSKPASAPASPSNWTDRGVTGNPGRQSRQPEHGPVTMRAGTARGGAGQFGTSPVTMRAGTARGGAGQFGTSPVTMRPVDRPRWGFPRLRGRAGQFGTSHAKQSLRAAALTHHGASLPLHETPQ
jgi:hypothetical protein